MLSWVSSASSISASGPRRFLRGRTAGPTSTLAARPNGVLIEAQAIQAAAERLDGNLIRAVDVILPHKGKVIVTGVGKSGYVARNIAATLQSTGTPSVFLHPAEAAHGGAPFPAG